MAHRKDKYVDHKLVRYTPLDGIRDAVGFVARFFSISNLKHGLRSVLGGFKEFAVFFFAVSLVQLLFWCPVISMETRAKAIKDEAYAAADYHIRIDAMTQNEWSDYYNSTFSITDNYDVEDRLYKSYEAHSYINRSDDELWSVTVLLNDETIEAGERFISLFPVKGENDTYYFSPSLYLKSEINEMHLAFLPVIIGLGLLGVVILLVLYNIRINHFKFRYGVYMSFGADFEKLFQTSAWELFSIALITFFPSFLLACVFETIVIGRLPTIVFGDFIRAIIWDFVVILLAVLPSVKFLATRTSTSLIVAGDNSNYVSSPQLSFKIFKKRFPIHYELFGFWRFRRYYATLLLSAIIFSSIFLCGFFVDSMVTASEAAETPEFVVKSNSGMSVEMALIESIDELDGVESILLENSISATSVNAYVLLTSRQRSNNYKYMLIDTMLYDQVVEGQLWEVEGDLEKVISDKRYVAVSEYINNSLSLNFKVGDKITLAILDELTVPIDYSKPDNKYILRQLLNDGIYNYLTVEIAAIIDTKDVDSRYTIAMNEDLYAEVVGRKPINPKAKVYASSLLNDEEIEDLYQDILSKISSLDSITVDRNYNSMKHSIVKSVSFSPTVILCAVFILLISPPVWLFSQAMFGSKRKLENRMLSAFGATDREIANLYLFSGVSLSIPAIIATVILGLFVSGIVFWIVNVFLSSLGMGADFRFTYEFSVLGLVISVFISLLSAIVSTYMPYVGWKRERDIIAKRHLGE